MAMKWSPRNPEVMRPVAVCLLLVGGAVIAEAVSGSSPEVIEHPVYETRIKFEKPVVSTKGAFEKNPYFDLDDPEG